MSTDVVLFTGPTILAAEIILDAETIRLDPAGQGDIFAAWHHYRPKIIGLIDGYFENVPAVWHKEILYVMAQGTHVLGSSSMGALRAAELYIFGMTGVGKIFEAYREGLIEDDDDVAVFHGPKELGYPPFSEPMVNIRQTALDALKMSLISEPFFKNLLSEAKELHYKERTYHNIFQHLEQSQDFKEELQNFRTWLPDGYRNLKKEDALLMIAKIQEMIKEGVIAKKVSYNFENTAVWSKSIEDYASSNAIAT